MPKLRVNHYLTMFCICLLLVLPVKTNPSLPPIVEPLLVPLAPMPINQQSALAAEAFVASLSAKSLLVVDVPSAAILLAKNSDETVPPASTTKMVTALVVRDLYQLDEVVTVKEAAFSTGHTIGFAINEQLTVESLLAALLVDSGNDAALALANHHPQGYDGFITAMNKKANELHLTHSSFRNPSGLDEEYHYSTARDLGVLARALLIDEKLKKLVSTKEMVIHDVSGLRAHRLYNTNVLLHSEPGVIGIKTGTTELAKENVITGVERNGHQLLIIVLGSENRYEDTKKSLTWVEQNYKWVGYELPTFHLVEPQ